MLKPSDLMDAGVRPYNSPARGRRSDLRFSRDIAPEGAANPLAAAEPSKVEASADRPSLPWFLLEGFAMYGAWLDVMTPVASSSDDLNAPPPRELSRRPKRGSTALVLLPAPGAERSGRPNWAIRVWRFVASGWANWRREQEIRQAAAALAEFDDRSLWDIGISGRSGIEYAVRHGRDDLAGD
jgi:uncharacterized protein YjiS (DUF1127 family)